MLVFVTGKTLFGILIFQQQKSTFDNVEVGAADSNNLT